MYLIDSRLKFFNQKNKNNQVRIVGQTIAAFLFSSTRVRRNESFILIHKYGS